MAGRLEGKVAIVTGGASGIGEATCRLFVREGVRGLVLADLNETAGKKIEGELRKYISNPPKKEVIEVKKK